MMYRVLSICLAGLITIHTRSAISGSKAQQITSNNQKVERPESHPSSMVDFDDVAQLKIATRKTNFHLAEMITVDIALLNRSSQPVLFHKLSGEAKINARNAEGQTVTVQTYGVADRALVPSSFVRLLPNEIVVHSFQLLVGCDKRAFAEHTSSQSNDLTIFRNGSFLNWGDACLLGVQPGTYNISVEVKNDFVVSSSGRGSVRTAVGKINSNSLEITVRE